jgi:23S rRNA pseudouridine1911/1915/1917 synthase
MQSNNVHEFQIEKSDLGKRLDILLSLKLPQLSRSFIKKVIESNNVRVNGEIEFRANFHAKEGDQVVVVYDEVQPQDKLLPENIPLGVLYEDDNVLAVNKSYGMVVHPADGNWTGTLMNAVMYHYSEQMRSIANNIRAGLIHRLDKETSGLVIIGKNNLGLYHFTKLFSERKVKKAYLVLAEGSKDAIDNIKNTETVENLLGRNPLNRKKVRAYNIGDPLALSPDLRVAKTIFHKIASKDRFVFLLAMPQTGRTHQIRVHVNNLGLKILGDKIYGDGEGARMMLHSYYLKMRNTDNNDLEITAQPQSDFLEILLDKGFEYDKFKSLINEFLS